MLEDVDRRRPTEVDTITGALVREAQKHRVEAPLHTAMYRLVKAREASYMSDPATSGARPRTGPQ
jgi:2-dehydropantoate 2-reductase